MIPTTTIDIMFPVHAIINLSNLWFVLFLGNGNDRVTVYVVTSKFHICIENNI